MMVWLWQGGALLLPDVLPHARLHRPQVAEERRVQMALGQQGDGARVLAQSRPASNLHAERARRHRSVTTVSVAAVAARRYF